MDFNEPGSVVEICIPNAASGSTLHFVRDAFVRTTLQHGPSCSWSQHGGLRCDHVNAVHAHVTPGGAESEAEVAAADDGLNAQDAQDATAAAAAAGTFGHGVCGLHC
jgi:hypothetical protein